MANETCILGIIQTPPQPLKNNSKVPTTNLVLCCYLQLTFITYKLLMKNIILTIVFLFAAISCKAQLNYLNNDTELFDGIKFNNVSLGDIMITSGDLTKMKALFGSDIQEKPNNTAPFLAKFLINNDISFGFEDETDTGNDYDLTYIRVKNSSVIVNVKGLSVKIGDHKSKFNNFIFNTYKEDNSFNFTDKETTSIGLSFKIDNNDKVSEINLTCF